MIPTLANPDLLASYWTLAGAVRPRDAEQHSPFDFRDRVEAAARAGFAGIGLWHADLAHILQRRSLHEMRSILQDNGIRHIELEFLGDWFMDGTRKHASDDRKHLLYNAAEALGAHHVKVGDFLRQTCPMEHLIESFASLCKEAADHGTKVGFELMPFANVDTLDDALILVHGANASNGGIILDLWHVVKLGIAYADLQRIAPRFLTSVELNDGYRANLPCGLRDETIHHRQFCGQGEFDVRGFVDAIRAMGYVGPWGVEVLCEAVRDWPLENLAAQAFTTAQEQFSVSTIQWPISPSC